MFSGSQFDGGLMASQSTQLSEATLFAAEIRDSLGLVPATAEMISQASQSGDKKSNFTINGVDVTNVTVVGMVFDTVERVTEVGFILDDATASIGCKKWVNDRFDKMEAEAIQDGKYEFLSRNNSIGCFLCKLEPNPVRDWCMCRPVTNFEEVTFHHLDCCDLQNTKQTHGGAMSLSQMGGIISQQSR